jgi:hypothetical protein
MTKSAIFFSKNCGDTDKERMKNVTGIQNEALCEKYLGLPTIVGRSTKDCFEAIPTKIHGLMNGWGAKQLSCAAQETLIKSVAQAVPTYSMSCSILAPATCQKIKTATSNYWWSSGVDKRGLHWRNWPDMCVPKAEGGLGFRDTKLFNIAMLGKQGWRLMVNPESLCARVLKGKYYHSKDFMTATKKKNASHTWRAILAGRKVLRMGCIKRIGGGQSTKIWKDQWIPGGICMKPVRRMEGATTEQVCDMLSPDGRSWDENALNQNLTPLDAAAVRQIPLGRSLQDIWAWSGERHGLYTVRSGYRLLASAAAQHRSYVQSRVAHSNHLNDPLWQKFWKCKVPPKVRVFWWRILNEYIPSRSNLHRQHIDPLSICDTCGAYDETTFHALLEGTYARQFWSRLRELTGVKLPVLTPESWSSALLEDRTFGEQDRMIILCGMWSVWRARNNRQYNKAPIDMRAAINWALDVCFNLLSVKESVGVHKGLRRAQRWQRPAVNI